VEFVRGSAVPNLDHDDIVNIRNDNISVYEKCTFYNLPSIVENTNINDANQKIYEKDDDVFYALSDMSESEVAGDSKSSNKHVNNKSLDFKKKMSKKTIQKLDYLNSVAKMTTELTPFNMDDKFYDPLYVEKRRFLPKIKKEQNLNVWSILKDAVGKDLSKFCVPGKLYIYSKIFSLFQ
jgi:hypothetical protein